MSTVGPDDGYAYSPIELSAIWAIPVDLDGVALSRSKVYEFHEHVAKPEDQHANELIERDTIAQLTNPGQPFCPYCVAPWEGTRYSHAVGAEMTLCCGHVNE